MATVTETTTERVVCHCLGVTETQLAEAIAEGFVTCVPTAMQQTGAGLGCTACHWIIKELLENQCPASSSSPTCVTK